MKKALPNRNRLVIFAIMLFALVGGLVLTTEAALADSKPSTIRLAFVNTSQFDFYLELYGQYTYKILIPANTEGKLFIKRGYYDYYMEACNYAKTGVIDLTKFQTLHIPVCGGRAEGFKHKEHHIDIATYIKPIRITIHNKTGEEIGVYFRTQTDHHFLNFEIGEVKELIVLREEGVDYVYSFQACGGQLITGYYTPRVVPHLVLECP